MFTRIKLGICFGMMIFLTACSSNKVVKTYEGKTLSKEAIAVLTAPENITVLAVNGNEVQQYLLSNIEVNYGLAAGENLIVFKYKSIWSKAKKDSETGARVDVVESEPLEVMFNAKAGEQYRFSFVAADNVREAKDIAEGFQAQILDSQMNLISESVALNTHKKAKNAQKEVLLAKTQSEAAESSESDNDSGSAHDQSALSQLKALWPKADADEKKAFLVWVFQ